MFYDLWPKMGEFLSNRLSKLPPYLFAELEQKKSQFEKKGIKIYDLSIGDPDLPPPSRLIEVLKEELNYKTHNYSSTKGTNELRESFAQWYKSRYGVSIDPDRELVLCVGTKEGIFHLPFAICDGGETIILPNPYYPVYLSAVTLAGCNPYLTRLTESNGFLVDFDSIPEEVVRSSRFIFLNYPSNPTSAVANEKFFKDAVAWAQKNNVYVVQDAAYQDLIYDSKPISILQVNGAKDVAIEFYSFSKLLNITGWRLGFAVGNQKIVSSLQKLKSNADSGQFIAAQKAVAKFLPLFQPFHNELLSTYKKRRTIFYNALKKAGHRYFDSKATFYVWWKCPDGFSSTDFTTRLLEKNRMLVIPGSAFGSAGEGYVRASLTCPDEDIARAMEGL